MNSAAIWFILIIIYTNFCLSTPMTTKDSENSSLGSTILHQILQLFDVHYRIPSSSPETTKRYTASSLETSVCRDIASWCPEYKQYCSDGYVSTNCERTCALCSVSGCSDQASWCLQYKPYCDHNTVSDNCQKTCGKCPSTLPNAINCNDGSTSCSQYKPYCYQTNYVSFMQQHCQATCGFCQGKCGVAEQRNAQSASSIVQGSNAPIGYYPWQAALFYDGDFFCGGSLIDETHVLTAAHCFEGLNTQDASQFHVVLGDNNIKVTEGMEQTITVSKITLHSDYETNTYKNDIALLKLTKAPQSSRFVKHICVPKNGEEIEMGRKCWVTGWGKINVASESSSNLLQVDLPIVDRSVCAQRNAFNNHVVTSDMLCAGYNDGWTFKSACHGDSGGPFQCEDPETGKWVLHGVVSWGSPQCNGLERYTVFTRVSKYISWIYKNKS